MRIIDHSDTTLLCPTITFLHAVIILTEMWQDEGNHNFKTITLTWMRSFTPIALIIQSIHSSRARFGLKCLRHTLSYCTP